LVSSDFENKDRNTEDFEKNENPIDNNPPIDDREEKSDTPDEETLFQGASLPENTPAENIDDDTRKELEDLARLFQEEYNKTLKEAEEKGEESEEDGSEEETLEEQSETESVLNLENLCASCGVRERDLSCVEDYEYCSKCRNDMINRPVPLVSRLFKVLAVFGAVISFFLFVLSFPAIEELAEGDIAIKERRINSAINHYSSAINKFESLSSDDGLAKGYVFEKYIPKASFVKARLIDALYKNGYVTYVESYVDTYFEDRLNNPLLYRVKKLNDEAAELSQNLQKAYDIIYDDVSKRPNNLPYDDLAKKLDEMKNTPVEGESKKGETYRKVASNLYKYYIASLSGRDFSEQIAMLEEIKELMPEAYWLYGQNLASIYAKAGEKDKALKSVEELKSYNSEDPMPYAAEAAAHRVSKDFDAAIAAAEKGYNLDPDYGYECLRQKAIAQLLKGQYNEAYETMSFVYEAFLDMDSEDYFIGDMGDTYAITCLAAGKKEEYDSVVELFESYGYNQRPILADYAAGKLTIEQIFLEGKADVA